jgi:hypothetical protein
MQHDLHVVLSPAQHMLDVQDTLAFPCPTAGAVQNTWSFTLHAGLHPHVLMPGVTACTASARDAGICARGGVSPGTARTFHHNPALRNTAGNSALH